MSLSFPIKGCHHTAANPRTISSWKANTDPLMEEATKRELRDTTPFVNMNPVTDSAMPSSNKIKSDQRETIDTTAATTKMKASNRLAMLAIVTPHSHFAGASAFHM